MIIPSEYFVTSGKGVSKTSLLNAFDIALWDARIGHLNIVPVSSIIPPNARERDYVELPAGSVTFAVMAKEEGRDGEVISAGLAWAEGRPHGYVLEAHGKMGVEELSRELRGVVLEVEEYANIEIVKGWRYLVESMKVPEGAYGVVIVALVLVARECTQVL